MAGFQAAFAVLIAIAVTHFSAWSHMVGFTALGVLAALFGRYAPLAERCRTVAICALMLTAEVLVTSLVSYLGTPSAAAMNMPLERVGDTILGLLWDCAGCAFSSADEERIWPNCTQSLDQALISASCKKAVCPPANGLFCGAVFTWI